MHAGRSPARVIDAYTRTLETVELDARLKRLEGTNEPIRY
jgi:hypothetical protein